MNLGAALGRWIDAIQKQSVSGSRITMRGVSRVHLAVHAFSFKARNSNFCAVRLLNGWVAQSNPCKSLFDYLVEV